jgi:hypothetical protein
VGAAFAFLVYSVEGDGVGGALRRRVALIVAGCTGVPYFMASTRPRRNPCGLPILKQHGICMGVAWAIDGKDRLRRCACSASRILLFLARSTVSVESLTFWRTT